jgi:hypothetical protein
VLGFAAGVAARLLFSDTEVARASTLFLGRTAGRMGGATSEYESGSQSRATLEYEPGSWSRRVKGHQHSPSVAMRIPHRQPGVGRFGFSPPLGMDEGVVQVL